MKTCKDCDKELPLSSFRLKTSNKDGHETRCKPCRNIRYNKADPNKVFAKLYHTQITHSISRGHPSPTYTLDELKSWTEKQPQAASIWQTYVDSGYDNPLRPSIDRIDDTKGYALDNIQIMTWGENRKKGSVSKQAGDILTAKSVVAYSKDGKMLKKYPTISEAARDIGGASWGIVSVANGEPVKDGRGKFYHPKTYKGFKWKWT
jgi:hypothetical protein